MLTRIQEVQKQQHMCENDNYMVKKVKQLFQNSQEVSLSFGPSQLLFQQITFK